MMEETSRQRVARLAREFLDDATKYDAFVTAVYEADQDDEIDELENLITHMPRRGGFGGLTEEQYRQYLDCVHPTIRKLET
jgi:hypothetical protein